MLRVRAEDSLEHDLLAHCWLANAVRSWQSHVEPVL